MRVLPLLLLPLVAGCAGYAADYWKPKASLIEDQLPRYGLAARNACMTERLTEDLSVWQLRQLADLASRLQAGGENPAVLGEADLLYVAGLVKDPAVREGVANALQACPGQAAAAPVADAAPDPAAPPAPAAPDPVPPGGTPAARWVNLGTAATGQSLSVDAASIENREAWRQAWFRMATPGETGPGSVSYLLRVDCAAKTITPMAARKYDATGTMTEQADHGPEWAVPLPVEAGTVMEIAHRALCS